MKRSLLVISYLLVMASCVRAQTGHLGGTGGSGGTASWQNGSRPVMFISTPSLPDATATVAYNQILAATNSVGSLTWTIMLGSLPAGLTLNSSTGAITGTPTTPGINTFTVLVTDSATPTAQTATKQFTLNVNCAPLQQTSTSPLPDAGSGIAYSFQFQSLGGQGSITWTQTGAPSGITLSSGGLLSGTSTTVGTSTLTVTATDSCPVPQVMQAVYTLTVSPGVTIVTTSPLAAGTTGVPYQVTLAAQGGTAPYTWTVTSGTLPAGLTLSPAGVISGTPTGVGSSTFTVTVTDAAAGTTNAPFTITISCVPLTLTSSTTLPNATQGQQYNFQFASAGGFGSDTWTLANGTTLPNGMTLSASGLLAGVPTLSVASTFDVTVTDSCPVAQTATNTFTLTIGNALTITTSSPLPNAVVGQAYSSGMAATGGTPPYSWSAPGGLISAGAEDILDYAMMPIGGAVNRYNSHLAATGLYKSYRLNAGLLWWLKNLQGFPWDGEIVGDTYVGQWYTEMDPSQNANCQAAGWPNCFNDPQAYKKYRTPVNLWKRYHVPGADDIVYTPGPNVYDLTVNCGADNQTGIDNLGVRGELTGPFTDVLWQTTFGGSIPDHAPYLLAQKWIKCTSNALGAACPTEEDYWLVKGYGQVRWCPKQWNGTSYVTGTCTTQANVVAGGAPTPNFACRIPNYPFPNSLPPGTTSTSSTQMTIDDRTGAITGTPTQTGTYGFTVQVEDSLGAITQKAMTLTVGCPALAITSPTTLPTATQGTAYNFQFVATGGAPPLSWSQIQGTLPTGLSVSAAGVLSGTPTSTGIFHFVIQVTDSCAPQTQSVQASFTLSVQANNGPLAITTTTLPAATEGLAYSTQIQAQGGTTPYVWTLASGTLPTGLSLSSAGVITGTPTAVGTFNFTVRVTDALAGTVTQALQIIVRCTTLSLTTTSPLAAGTASQAYSQQFTASGGVTPYAFALASGTLPTGLSLSAGGALTGTPTVAGTSSFSVRVTDSCVATAQSTTAPYSLTINPAPVPLAITTFSVPNATESVAYTAQLNATGGTTPYTWAITLGSLPTGLSLSAGGLISGTPTTVGSFNFTARATDNAAATAFQSYTIVVTCPTLFITTPNQITNGVQGQSYSFQFSSSGGIPAITWGFSSGSAPSGLSLSAGGLLSGTPSTNGTFTLNIQATDHCVATPQVTLKQFTMQIIPALTITTASPLPQGNQGTAYSTTISAVGGTTPYTWAVSAGSLPAGLTLNTSTGVISGTPTASGTSAFTIRVTDANSTTTTKAFSLTISCPALTIATTSPIPPATQGQPYSFQFASNGGDPRTVTLNWTASVTPGVTGYNIYRGVTSGTYTRIATGVACCTYLDTTVVNGGIYYYAVTAVSSTGESAFSSEVVANANLIWSGTGIPAGLTLDPTGLLHGTPTGSGTTSMSITVTDTCSPTPQSAGPTSFSITINAAPPPVSITTSSPLAGAVQGTAYTSQMAATGGTPPYTWAITASSLPAGLTLATNGLISGTPTTVGTSSPTIRVTDSLGANASGSFSLTVSCTALAISTTALPTGTQNSPYSFQMTSTGGIGAKTWSLFAGSFPTGVSISSAGLISGTPTNSGSFNPQIRVTDACSTPQTATTTFPLTINPATVPLQITTGTPLPAAIQNSAYSVTLAATGGTPPYGSWTVTVGTLPTGLTLTAGTGVIAGTPTVAGTSSFTVRVTDGAAANATKAFSLTVNAATAADNRYCTPGGTWIGPTTDGVATLPNRCVNTALSNTPASGPTKTVCASGCDFTTVSAALTAASCGWVIQVKALSGTAQASYGGFTLPAKSCTASNWIIIETDQIAASGMAPEGTRITPAWVGISSMPGYPTYGQPTTGAGIFLPKITGGSNNVINRASGANFYRLIGLEVTSTAGVNITDLTLTSNTDHIIWDRMLVHGGSSTTGHATTNNTRAFDWAQSTNQALIDSYVYDFHTSGAGSSCVLIGGTSSVPEGPHKIVHNFCSAADSFSGLGGGGAGTASTVPTDLEVRRNYFFKPLFWKRNDPSYFGTSFTVKDHIDWKNVQRVLVEGNIMDNTWGQQSDQPGPAVEFGAKNQSSFNSGTASSDGAGTLTATSGTFNSNVVSSSCASPGHCRVNYNGAYFAQTWIDSTHITVRSSTGTVPPVSTGTPYTAYAPGLNPNATVADITMRYNLIRHASRGIEVFQATSDGGDFAKFTGRIEIHDNVADDLDGFHWNLSPGACCAWALGLYVSNSNPVPSNLDQVDIHHNTLLPFLTGGGVGDGPSFGFSGQSNTNGTIGHLKLYDNISASGWGLATLGVCTTPKTALKDMQCMDSLAGAPQNTYCFDHNVLATTTATSGTVTGTANIPPYPGPADSPGCGFARTGSQLPASYNAIQFTNLNGANGGNYQLQNTSPYHNTASDGTDPGVNWLLLQLNIAGVQ